MKRRRKRGDREKLFTAGNRVREDGSGLGENGFQGKQMETTFLRGIGILDQKNMTIFHFLLLERGCWGTTGCWLSLSLPGDERGANLEISSSGQVETK